MVSKVHNNHQVSTLDANNINEKWEHVKDSQGLTGSIWNDIKEVTKIGSSEADCESMLKKYNNGEISTEKAMEYIEKYENGQKDAVNLVANIATGVGAIAAATTAAAAGPIGWGMAIATGAPIGAALKTGLKIIDRATNDIQGDEFDADEITKDAISGSVIGLTSAVTSGVGAGVKAGKFGLSVANGAKCSTTCGAISGAVNYATDVAVDDNKTFDCKDFAKNVLATAGISGFVGATVGAGIYGTQCIAGNIGKEISKNTTQTIISDSMASSSRKALNQWVKSNTAVA